MIYNLGNLRFAKYLIKKVNIYLDLLKYIKAISTNYNFK